MNVALICRRAEIAALMPDEPTGHRDIILQRRDGGLTRISEFHRSYDPLHYVIMHPHGNDGWSLDLKRSTGITAQDYYAFHMRYRPGHFNLIPRCGRLFQQFLVDAFVKIETDRLMYVRQNQDGLNGFRTDTVRGITDAINGGDEHGDSVGRVVLPASFVVC